MKPPIKKQPPSPLALLLESRALLDIASVPFSLASRKEKAAPSPGSLPIIMFPGFGSDELYLKALEKYLQKLGYQTEGWGLGKNLAGMDLPHVLEDLSSAWEIDYPEGYSPESYRGEGGVPFLADKAITRVKQRSKELGSPVVLIGWSLGGYLAREVARELPDHVAQIITFGAPAYGGPKYSRVASLFKAKNYDLEWIEKSIDKRDKNPIKQPITAIYSKLDGIVSWTATIDTTSPNVNNVEVSTSHLGMGFSLKVWKIVATALQQGADARAGV